MISLKKLREFGWEHELEMDFDAEPEKDRILISFENPREQCRWTYWLTFAQINDPECPVTAESIINKIPKELYSTAPKNDP